MDKFNFHIGFDEETDDIIKSSAKYSSSKRYDNMVLKGLASDNSEDRQEEILEPSGFLIDDFISEGLINLEHFTSRKGDPKYWIGEPTNAFVKSNEFYVESKLWKAREMARNFWDTLIEMKESGSNRKAGYSIEGAKMELDPNNKKRVLKARISNCAVTMSPVNKNSWIDIVKGNYKSEYVDYSKDIDNYLFRFEKGGDWYIIKKDFKIEKQEDNRISVIRKAILSGSINLNCLPKIFEKLC